MNQGRKKNPPRKGSTVAFVQESLNWVQGTNLAVDGGLGSATLRALSEFSGRSTDELRDASTLDKVYKDLFRRVASGK